MTDLYLMYAEALNESQESPTQDVYDYVDLVREPVQVKIGCLLSYLKVIFIISLIRDSGNLIAVRIISRPEITVTQPIAKAVKAQLLLLAASPLFNGNSDYINVKDNQGRHLFPTQVDNSKWKLAADAALEAINCAKENGHEKLYTFSLPINSISAATRKLLDIGEAVTEKWNEEISPVLDL